MEKAPKGTSHFILGLDLFLKLSIFMIIDHSLMLFVLKLLFFFLTKFHWLTFIMA